MATPGNREFVYPLCEKTFESQHFEVFQKIEIKIGLLVLFFLVAKVQLMVKSKVTECHLLHRLIRRVNHLVTSRCLVFPLISFGWLKRWGFNTYLLNYY